MKNLITIAVIFLCASALITPCRAQDSDSAGKDNYIEFQKRFDDRVGILTEQDLALIKAATDRQEEEFGLKAFLLIMPSIPEWDFAEFGRDQFHLWQTQGHVDNRSYLILISFDDKKTQIVRGSYIDRLENDYEIKRLRDRFYIELKEGNFGKAIEGYISGLSELPTLKKNILEDKKRNKNAGYYTLIGILILILVFMRMGFIRKQKEHEREERKRKSGPFIE